MKVMVVVVVFVVVEVVEVEDVEFEDPLLKSRICISGQLFVSWSSRMIVFTLIDQPSVFVLTVCTLWTYKYHFSIDNSNIL